MKVMTELPVSRIGKMRRVCGYAAAIAVTPYLLIKIVWTFGLFLPTEQMGAADFWAYEQIFVMISLVGVGICLPLALAGYAKVRWPEALGGPTDHAEMPGHTLHLQITMARLVAAGCILLGVIKVFWAAGGTFGIDPARLNHRDVWWHLLTLSTGVWAIAGAWGLLVMTTRRGTRRFLPPMAAVWISSGMLFSFNLFSAIRPDSQYSPEYPLARVLTTEAGIVLGVIMGMIILLVLHDRRRALRDNTS